MKLIIEIPFEAYYTFKNDLGKGNLNALAEIIANGKPYEEKTRDNMNGDLISRSELKEDCGQWIKHEDFNDSIKYGCNQCGNLANVPSNFCPNCGKRMFFGKRINLTGAEK